MKTGIGLHDAKVKDNVLVVKAVEVKSRNFLKDEFDQQIFSVYVVALLIQVSGHFPCVDLQRRCFRTIQIQAYDFGIVKIRPESEPVVKFGRARDLLNFSGDGHESIVTFSWHSTTVIKGILLQSAISRGAAESSFAAARISCQSSLRPSPVLAEYGTTRSSGKTCVNVSSALRRVLPESLSALVPTIKKGRPADCRNSSSCRSLSWGGTFKSTRARQRARERRSLRYGSMNPDHWLEISRGTRE